LACTSTFLKVAKSSTFDNTGCCKLYYDGRKIFEM